MWREEGRPAAGAEEPQYPLDRAGHGRCRAPEPSWLRSADQPDPRGAGEPRDPLRSRRGDLVVDPAIPCQHVYGAMASRVLRGLVHSPGCDLRRWRSTWARAATRRPASSPTPGIVRLTPAWLAGSPNTGIISSLGSRAFKTAVLVDRPMEGLQAIASSLESWLGVDVLGPAVDALGWLLKNNRKGAAEVNREFLDWLRDRRQPERPFFAFLNYYDAHYPYEIPERAASTGSVPNRATRVSRP